MDYSTSKLRQLFFACFPIVLVSLLAGMGRADEFVNEDRGFAFTVPDSWKKGGPSETNPELSASIYFPTKAAAEFVTVDVSEVKEGIDFKFADREVPKKVEDDLKKVFPTIAFRKPERTEVGGYPTWKLFGEVNRNGVDERLSVWVVLYRKQFYYIRWLASGKSSHPDDVKTVLETFHFTNDPFEGEEQKSVVLDAAILASKGWLPVTVEKKGQSGMLLFIPDDEFRETFSLDVVPASVNAKKMFLSDRYLSLLRDSLRATTPSLKMISGGRLELDGVKAWRYETEEQSNKKTVHGKYWQVINNDRVYTMTWRYRDGSTREQQVNRMVQSLHFLTPMR